MLSSTVSTPGKALVLILKEAKRTTGLVWPRRSETISIPPPSVSNPVSQPSALPLELPGPHIVCKLTNWLLRNPEVHYRHYINPPWSLSSARAIQSPGSQPTTLKSILILSSHLRLGLPKGLLLSGFPTKTLYAFLYCSIRATCPAHLTRLHLRFLIMNTMRVAQNYVTFSILL